MVDYCMTVTEVPRIRRVEDEDPRRRLAGVEHRLKGSDQIKFKVEAAMAERDLTAEQALGTVRDAIRYAFEYSNTTYTEGVRADTARLSAAGFELLERRNMWTAEFWKGIVTIWREPDSEHTFEVQFHTRVSFRAQHLTHDAYRCLRDPETARDYVRELRTRLRDVFAQVPVPPGATGIPDFPPRSGALYWAVLDESRGHVAGVIRRTYDAAGEADEAFTRKGIWRRTATMYSAERGNLDCTFVPISEKEANQITGNLPPAGPAPRRPRQGAGARGDAV
jgi:hypothetical protein